MTQLEKLALRLSQFPNRLVNVMLFVDSTGALTFWVIADDKKVEGANPPSQYQVELDCVKKERKE